MVWVETPTNPLLSIADIEALAGVAHEAGAVLVNDVSGGLADEGMARLVADAGVPWVLMHWRGHSREMQAAARYGDVVTEVAAELTARVEDVVAAASAPGDGGRSAGA